MHGLYALVLAVLAAVSPSFASAPLRSAAATEDPLIPFKTLMAPATVQAPKLSLDGKHLSFLSPVNGVANIMVAPVNDVKAARPVTYDTRRGIQTLTIVFEAYAGQYNWSGYKIDVTKEGNRLFLQLAGQPRAEIFPSSETEFFFKTVSSTVTFVKDKEGKVTKLIFTSGGKAYEGLKVK